MKDEESLTPLASEMIFTSVSMAEKLVSFILSQNIVGKQFSEKDMSESEAAASALVSLGTLLKFDHDNYGAIIGIVKKMIAETDVPPEIIVSMNIFIAAVGMARNAISSVSDPLARQEGHC